MSDVEGSEKIERNKCCISIGYRGVYCVYAPSISNLYHIKMVNYNSVLCKLFCTSCKFCYCT